MIKEKDKYLCSRCQKVPKRHGNYCNRCWEYVKPITRHVVLQNDKIRTYRHIIS